MTDDTIVTVKYIEWVFYETYFRDAWAKDYTKKIRHEIQNDAINNWTAHRVLTEIKKAVHPRTAITFGYIEDVVAKFKKQMMEYANYNEFNRDIFLTAFKQADDILDLINCMH